MRTLLICSALICSTFISSTVFAKSLTSKKKISQASDYFMSQLVSGDFESAYSLMSSYIGVDSQKFEERGKKMALALKKVNQSQGKPLSFSQLKKQSVGEHFYKISYLLKYQEAALIWELNYYQPEQGWKLIDISYNININALFE